MEREEVPELNTFKNISLNEQYMILFESQNSQKKKQVNWNSQEKYKSWRLIIVISMQLIYLIF